MFNPDLPITKSTEDVLNRGTFAKSLAKTLLQYDQPSSFTIGLYGEWGSGKTSLLNMILENVESGDDSAVILRFNPWLCSEPRQLIAQFFKQMAAAIKLKKPTGEKVWELIDQYAGIFDAVNVFCVGELAGTILSTAGKALAGEAEKREIASAWLELAFSCAKVSVKNDADELKAMEKQKQALGMEMG